MERSKTLTEQAAGFRDLLAAGNIEEIDFDRLAAMLSEIVPELKNVQSREETILALRRDYEGRIAGMVKAMAAVDRSGKSYEEALRSLEELPGLTGEELVACYHKTAARFRDLFPTTFGHGPIAARPGAADMSVYK